MGGPFFVVYRVSVIIDESVLTACLIVVNWTSCQTRHYRSACSLKKEYTNAL